MTMIVRACTLAAGLWLANARGGLSEGSELRDTLTALLVLILALYAWGEYAGWQDRRDERTRAAEKLDAAQCDLRAVKARNQRLRRMTPPGGVRAVSERQEPPLRALDEVTDRHPVVVPIRERQP